MDGEYYLHANGALIFKPHGGVDTTSAFVRRSWPLVHISPTPDHFVRFLAEAHQAGALAAEIDRLAKHNNLDEHRPGWRQIVFGGAPNA